MRYYSSCSRSSPHSQSPLFPYWRTPGSDEQMDSACLVSCSDLYDHIGWLDCQYRPTEHCAHFSCGDKWGHRVDHYRVSRGINCYQICGANLDTDVLAALHHWAFPAFLPHSRRLVDQVMSERACSLERAPVGPADSRTTLLRVPDTRGVLHGTGLACFIRVSLHRLLPCDL